MAKSKSFTHSDIVKAAERIRDFEIEMMNEDTDPKARAFRKTCAMSEIEGLKNLVISLGYGTKSPVYAVLHNIWRQLLNA